MNALLVLLAVAAGPTATDLTRSLVDEVGPRPSGSEADARAIDWAIRQMKAAGLQRVHPEPFASPRWQRGEEWAEIVSPVPQRLAIAALGPSVGTPPGGAEGEVVEVASLQALEQLDPAAVKGRIVFLNVPMQRTRGFEGYHAVAPLRRNGPAAAARKGAVAFLIRSLTASSARLPHAGSFRVDPGVPGIPSAALAVPDAELLHRAIARGVPVRVRLHLGCRVLPEGRSANVVGEIPGGGAAGEIVLLGAHLDSWDLGQGALDDAAGVAMVLVAARSISAPRRTVRVVLFNNEEAGLGGARAYAEQHRAELDRHVLALEMDHGTSPVFYQSVLAAPGPAADAAIRELGAALKPFGLPEIIRGKDHGADLGPLRAAGVPVAMLAQDSSTYFDAHHSADDTMDRVEAASLEQVTAVVTAFARAAANGKGDLGRIPPELREDR